MSQPSLSVFPAVNSMSIGSVSRSIYAPTRTPIASVRLLYHAVIYRLHNSGNEDVQESETHAVNFTSGAQIPLFLDLYSAVFL